MSEFYIKHLNDNLFIFDKRIGYRGPNNTFIIKKKKAYKQLPDLDNALISFISVLWSLYDCRDIVLVRQPELEICRTEWDCKRIVNGLLLE